MTTITAKRLIGRDSADERGFKLFKELLHDSNILCCSQPAIALTVEHHARFHLEVAPTVTCGHPSQVFEMPNTRLPDDKAKQSTFGKKFDDESFRKLSGGGLPEERVPLLSATLLPISIFTDEQGKEQLALGCVGQLVGRENCADIAPGSYVIHVFDILAEARAAQKVLATMHPMGWIKPDRVGISIEAMPGGEGALLFKTSGLSAPTIAYEGTNGPVCFTVHDHRRLASQRPPLALSVRYSSREMLNHLQTSGDLCVDQYSRAKALAALTSEVMVNPTCMNIYQREIEKIPGAAVSLGAVSVEQVIEELEDTLSEMDISAEIPSSAFVHQKILRAVGHGKFHDPEMIVSGIVEVCLEHCVEGE